MGVTIIWSVIYNLTYIFLKIVMLYINAQTIGIIAKLEPEIQHSKNSLMTQALCSDIYTLS